MIASSTAIKHHPMQERGLPQRELLCHPSRNQGRLHQIPCRCRWSHCLRTASMPFWRSAQPLSPDLRAAALGRLLGQAWRASVRCRPSSFPHDLGRVEGADCFAQGSPGPLTNSFAFARRRLTWRNGCRRLKRQPRAFQLAALLCCDAVAGKGLDHAVIVSISTQYAIGDYRVSAAPSIVTRCRRLTILLRHFNHHASFPKRCSICRA